MSISSFLGGADKSHFKLFVSLQMNLFFPDWRVHFSMTPPSGYAPAPVALYLFGIPDMVSRLSNGYFVVSPDIVSLFISVAQRKSSDPHNQNYLFVLLYAFV